jgi:hypothetical protein
LLAFLKRLFFDPNKKYTANAAKRSACQVGHFRPQRVFGSKKRADFGPSNPHLNLGQINIFFFCRKPLAQLYNDKLASLIEFLLVYHSPPEVGIMRSSQYAKHQPSRRHFLGEVGFGMIAASVGASVIGDMGLACAPALASERLHFGELEPLVVMLQETQTSQLLPKLVQELQGGMELKRLVAAAALANARTFGGEDYIGFHTMMALAPSFRMSQELPSHAQALPVLKVLYRNTNRIQEFGGSEREVLRSVDLTNPATATPETLHAAVQARDVNKAETEYAALISGEDSAKRALNHALMCVEDETEIHRVALPYRAWDLLEIVGIQHAHTMLRQSIRYCVKAGKMNHQPKEDSPSFILPRMFDQHRLDQHLSQPTNTRTIDGQWIRSFAETIFKATPSQAADATAMAIAEGVDRNAICRAITLAANQLVLRDRGRTPREESPGKPIGSVHGDSIGVHATDSANAWTNLAKVADAKHSVACLILGAFQVAYDRVSRGGDFLHWEPLPVNYQLDRVVEKEPSKLIGQLDEAIRGNLQARAAAIVAKYGQLGLEPKPLFECLMRYAVSEDGALHAEKYYRTVHEEFQFALPEHRWEFVTSLARVTASEFGRTAPGYQEAVELLRRSS